ncbi:glutathione S-transferase family protein [Enterobacter sp. Cy-643]|uniref:glutathione S-transferase family protein n=1 Tax=Enterobacter sp. Cy-643 TaxID=2608346 RepID=UPI00142081BB|nr:glutathione S-transferase family protein [Enterobacter sp. Cy-643]NIF31725.1 glutathione S-transferase family protein [Enterobacter sp. Cy-643]
MYKLYGVSSFGSAITELMLTLVEEPYKFIDVDGFDTAGPMRDRLLAINPLAQVPTLVLENGEVLTESAAIALWILDRHPQYAPPIGTPERQQFYRLLIWIVANVYPTFTYGDYGERWVEEEATVLTENLYRYRETLWLWFETQLSAGPYIFGERLTLLDLYLPAMTRWRPRQAWFDQHTPKLAAVANRVRALPQLNKVLGRNGML